MKRKLVLGAVGALSLVAATFSAYRYGWPIYSAESTVRANLNDPDSAKFSEVRFSRALGGTCGLVNAKNKMGGYVGFTHFVVTKSGEVRFGEPYASTSASLDEQIEALKKRIDFAAFAGANCDVSN